jgi:hypothetical protein
MVVVGIAEKGSHVWRIAQVGNLFNRGLIVIENQSGDYHRLILAHAHVGFRPLRYKSGNRKAEELDSLSRASTIGEGPNW